MKLTQYGGDTTMPGTVGPGRSSPWISFQKTLFHTHQPEPCPNTNTWAMEVFPGKMFAYELARPGRLFRVEF
jgi:hypothetical protein